jgi:hypothetical protein
VSATVDTGKIRQEGIMRTYDEIAERHGLTGWRRERFIKYMRTRWADTEEQKCSDGYTEEWAERFSIGIEY